VNQLSLIRIAIHLCLIAALVVQPMAIVFARGTCPQGQCCQGPSICQPCECCEATSETVRCCCCSGHNEPTGGCCAEDTDSSTPEPITSIEKTDRGGQFAFSRCLCGLHSEPIAPAPQRVPVPEVRDLVVIAYLDHVGSNVGLSIRPDHVNASLPIGDHSPGFTQRFLCIWRI